MAKQPTVTRQPSPKQNRSFKQLKKSLKQLMAEKAKMLKENDSLRTANEECRAECKQLKDEGDRLEAARTRILMKYEEEIGKHQKHQNDLDELKEEVIARQKDWRCFERQLDNFAGRLTRDHRQYFPKHASTWETKARVPEWVNHHIHVVKQSYTSCRAELKYLDEIMKKIAGEEPCPSQEFLSLYNRDYVCRRSLRQMGYASQLLRGLSTYEHTLIPPEQNAKLPDVQRLQPLLEEARGCLRLTGAADQREAL